MNLGFGPGKRAGGLVVGVDEGIDVGPELIHAPETCMTERVADENGEPALHLVEPGGMGGVKWKRTLGWRVSHRSRLGLCVLRLSRMTCISIRVGPES